MTDSQFIPNTIQEQEEWRPIPGYEGIYEISSLGRLRILVDRYRNAKKGQIMKHHDWKGYPAVTLANNAKKRWHTRVHILLALTFIGPCPEGHQVDHKDGKKDNHSLDNLEYVTPGENTRRAHRMGLISTKGDTHWMRKRPQNILRGTGTGHAKHTEDDVINIRFLASEGVSFRAIARTFDTDHGNIAKIVRRKYWTHI